MLRRVARALPAILVVLLCWPAAAAAQEALDGCKSPIIANQTTPLREVIKAEGKPDVTHTLLKGNVEIVCDDTRLYADEIEWYSDSEWMYARGHVLLQQPQIRINADSARMNRRTHLGTFNAVEGSIRMHDQKPESDQFGQMEPDALFDGKTLEKTGPHTYKLNDGEITTCTQPTPRWQMGLTDAIITPGEHVVMKNMVLRVKDVPVFYFPFMYYPINKEGRSTGFLMPSYGSSSVTGFHLSNAFFWAIDRSQDATFYHDYYKKAGQGFGGNYEYALDKGSRGDTTVSIVDQKTNTVDGFSAQTSYTIRGSANQALPGNFRLMGNVNYFSSVASQQIYQQNLAAFSSRSSQWSGAVSGGVGRYRVTGQIDQSDLYNGSAPAQRSGHLPLVNFTVPDAPIGHTRIYFGVQNEVIYRLDQTNVTDPTTDRNLWRTDILPTFRVPLSTLPYFNVTTTASWRFTSWSQSIDPADPTQSHAIGAPIYRQLFNVKTTIDGPVFSRVFQPKDFGYAEKLKHVIDPQFTIDWWSPFNDYSQVIKQDGTDYLVGGTTNLTYGVAQHILAKRHVQDGSPGQSARDRRDQPATDVLDQLPRGLQQPVLPVELVQSWRHDGRQQLLAGASQRHRDAGRTGERHVLPELRHALRRDLDARRIGPAHGRHRADDGRLVQDQRGRRQPQRLRADGALAQHVDDDQAAGPSRRRLVPVQLGHRARHAGPAAAAGLLQQPVLRNFLRLSDAGRRLRLQARPPVRRVDLPRGPGVVLESVRVFRR